MISSVSCHPYGDHGYVKICLKERLFHSGVWGSKFQVFTKLVQSRKVLHLEVWNIQGKGLILVGFLSNWSRGVRWRDRFIG